MCGYKVRYLEKYGGAPYFLLSVGGGADVAPRVHRAGLGRVGVGWDAMFDRKRSIFFELGGAAGTMVGDFGSAGFRW